MTLVCSGNLIEQLACVMKVQLLTSGSLHTCVCGWRRGRRFAPHLQWSLWKVTNFTSSLPASREW